MMAITVLALANVFFLMSFIIFTMAVNILVMAEILMFNFSYLIFPPNKKPPQKAVVFL